MDGNDTYPGSSQPLRSAQRRLEAMAGAEGWDSDMYRQRLEYRGEMTDFFTIGALAVALRREPGTLRDWEEMGYLPRAPRRTESDAPTTHGRRRLYTRVEIEGLMALAEEEGLYQPGARVAATDFPSRARHLFETLRVR